MSNQPLQPTYTRRNSQFTKSRNSISIDQDLDVFLDNDAVTSKTQQFKGISSLSLELPSTPNFKSSEDK